MGERFFFFAFNGEPLRERVLQRRGQKQWRETLYLICHLIVSCFLVEGCATVYCRKVHVRRTTAHFPDCHARGALQGPPSMYVWSNLAARSFSGFGCGKGKGKQALGERKAAGRLGGRRRQRLTA